MNNTSQAIGPNPCTQCGGPYGKHMRWCTLKPQSVEPEAKEPWVTAADKLCEGAHYVGGVTRESTVNIILEACKEFADSQQEIIDTLNGQILALQADAKIWEHQHALDTVRLDWLETHPLLMDVHGGSDDGRTGTFWGVAAALGTLREVIDEVMKQERLK